MPLVTGYDDAKKHPLKRSNQLAYFNFRDAPDMPHANLNGHEPGKYFSPAHFHQNDQFQVVTDGEFRIGRHKLTPYCVHFTRAYTPYGPLVSDGTPFTFLVMRAHRDAGSQPVAEEQEQLSRLRDRRPWQVSQPVVFPPPAARQATDVLLEEIPNVRDDQGLAGYTMVLKPNVTATAPDPSRGDGQYIVVVKGSFWHNNQEQRALGLVFVKPDEGAYRIQAGAEGLEALVLNFPEVKPRPVQVKRTTAGSRLRKWQCILCAFAYDEALGMPDEGIAPGTRWEDVAETWSCPDCSANKSDFEMVEV